jgi:hypothetical protein
MALSNTTVMAIRGATDKKGRSLFAPLAPCSESEVRKAEVTLGVRFPDSFSEFLKQFGAGKEAAVGWWIHAPSECYAFDLENGRARGCIALAQDVCGNYLAFDPSEPESSGERPIYYFCHDPFGHARIASSFGEFLADAAKQKLKDEFVADIPANFVYETPEPIKERSNAKWWAFWRKS